MWPQESDAVRDTFLPTTIRHFLCPQERDVGALCQHAFRITGGHPWYYREQYSFDIVYIASVEKSRSDKRLACRPWLQDDKRAV
jgi:hypothetical protein